MVAWIGPSASRERGSTTIASPDCAVFSEQARCSTAAASSRMQEHAPDTATRAERYLTIVKLSFSGADFSPAALTAVTMSV